MKEVLIAVQGASSLKNRCEHGIKLAHLMRQLHWLDEKRGPVQAPAIHLLPDTLVLLTQ